MDIRVQIGVPYLLIEKTTDRYDLLRLTCQSGVGRHRPVKIIPSRVGRDNFIVMIGTYRGDVSFAINETDTKFKIMRLTCHVPCREKNLCTLYA